ncbi:MAG: pyridoxal phosphate-dependent aminotransferase [Lachnospiraceae bacterium]|nr:pyridoxal phosphate-dependent aminotransferase [Lachnospiraceae bacterium]
MEQLEFLDRRGTNCNKWDGQTGMFQEEGLHGMWVADMDISVPTCVKEALQKYIDFGAYGYYKIPDSYYDAIIGWEKRHYQLDVKKEWIRYSPGVVAAFNWWIQIMTKEKDAVIVNTPVYYPFLSAVKGNNRTLITSDLKNDNGVYSIDYKDFEDKIVKHNVKAFILCSPHNPVGRVWKEEELKPLLDICNRHQVFVIADEIHQDLVFGEHKQIPALSLVDDYSNIVALTAPSKTFNLAAGKNSVIYIPDETLRAKWDDFAEKIRCGSGNAFGYIAAAAAYKGGDDWYEAVKELIEKNARYVKETFAKELPKVVVSPLEGTYLIWIDLRAYVEPKKTKEFVQKTCRLAVDFGDWFGGETFEGFIRMNLATSPENVKIGVESIVQHLK